MQISVTQKGSFHNTERYLRRLSALDVDRILNKYGERGVAALSAATPIDSSLTANSWYYEIVQRPGYHSIRWHNSNVQNGRPIAILLEYGHGTRNGGYVQGHDYIMPAILPVFEQINKEVWEEVIRL